MINSYAKQANRYKEQEVLTASPEELLILLYDGAIRFLNVSKHSLENKKMDAFHVNLIKAQRIVSEFMITLDMEVGGEVAVNLYRLYDYLHYRLLQANLKKDVAMVEEVLSHLRALRETWGKAIQLTHTKGE